MPFRKFAAIKEKKLFDYFKNNVGCICLDPAPDCYQKFYRRDCWLHKFLVQHEWAPGFRWILPCVKKLFRFRIIVRYSHKYGENFHYCFLTRNDRTPRR